MDLLPRGRGNADVVARHGLAPDVARHAQVRSEGPGRDAAARLRERVVARRLRADRWRHADVVLRRRLTPDEAVEAGERAVAAGGGGRAGAEGERQRRGGRRARPQARARLCAVHDRRRSSERLRLIRAAPGARARGYAA